jgi:UDP-glucose 4-epimerase
MRIIITGSSGYIGSCCYEFFKKRFKVYGVDKVKSKISEQNKFFRCNLNNKIGLEKIFSKVKPLVVIHLAGESTIDGIKNKKNYLLNNIKATINLLKVIKKNKIKFLIFSSTAAVYKKKNSILRETSRTGPDNIYGLSKLICEKLIKKNLKKTNTRYAIFRFFNVCSSLYPKKVGELHNPETHFIPIIVKKILDREIIKIYGNNYKTRDGTCIRDYIHIKDILTAFYKVIHFLIKNDRSILLNLGSGKGYSNLEIVRIINKKIKTANNNFVFNKRRLGDAKILVCSNKKAKKTINWKPIFSKIENIIEDELLWLKFLKKKKIYRKTIY